jgi:hypothetical protein
MEIIAPACRTLRIVIKAFMASVVFILCSWIFRVCDQGNLGGAKTFHGIFMFDAEAIRRAK